MSPKKEIVNGLTAMLSKHMSGESLSYPAEMVLHRLIGGMVQQGPKGTFKGSLEYLRMNVADNIARAEDGTLDDIARERAFEYAEQNLAFIETGVESAAAFEEVYLDLTGTAWKKREPARSSDAKFDAKKAKARAEAIKEKLVATQG